MAASAEYFKAGDGRAPTLDDLADHYRERRMAAVVFTVDSEHQTGHPPIPNDDVARAAQRHPDVLIPFGSVDPHRGDGRRRRGATARRPRWACAGSSSTRRCRASRPTTRWPTRSTRRSRSSAYPRCSTAGRPASAPGCRAAAGCGCGYSNPMLLDDVAADFPELTIILAHPSFPWQDEALSVATHKAERLHRPVGLVAEVLPAAARAVRQHAAQGQGAVRLGLPAHHARPVAGRLRRRSPIKDEVRPLILKENAIRVLGLRGAPT